MFGDLKNIWAEQYDTPLKYIGGDSEWSFPISIYGDTHPINIMDTFGYKNPWIDEEDLKKSGAIIIDRNPYHVIEETRQACPYLSEDYVIEPMEYKFFVHNALGMPKEYTVAIFVVPPIKD